MIMKQIFAEFCPHLMHVPTSKPDEISEAEYVITDGPDYICATKLHGYGSVRHFYYDPTGYGIGNGMGFGNGVTDTSHTDPSGEFGFEFSGDDVIWEDAKQSMLDGKGYGFGGGTVDTYRNGTGSDHNTLGL